MKKNFLAILFLAPVIAFAGFSNGSGSGGISVGVSNSIVQKIPDITGNIGVGTPTITNLTQFAPPTIFTNHGEILLRGGVISFSLVSPNGTNVFDGDVTTSSDGYPNGWIGLYLTNAATLTRWRYAAEPSVYNSYNREILINGCRLWSAEDGAASNRTNWDSTPVPSASVPTYPWNQRFWYNERLVNGVGSHVAYAIEATNGYLGVAELQFIGIGSTNGRPVQPVISPFGGHFTNGTVTVTMTTISTSSKIYYTLDNTTPTTNSYLYTSPFTLNITNEPVRVKAIAVDTGLTVPNSYVSGTADFRTSGFIPLDNLRDQNGNLVEAHGGKMLDDTKNGNGILWYGANANLGCVQYDVAGNMDSIWCYQSFDMLNWKLVGQVAGCPSSWSHMYRPHVIYNQQYGYYVLWAYATSPTIAVGIATSTVPQGPFTWINTNALPFPGTVKYGDLDIYVDGYSTAWLVQNTNPPTGGVCMRRLDPTYTTWTSDPVTTILTNYNESPAMFQLPNGTYACAFSIGNYYNSPGYPMTERYYTNANTVNPTLGAWTYAGTLFGDDQYSNTPSPHFFNVQIGSIFRSPWNTNQLIGVGDYWYDTTQPIYDIYTKQFDTNNSPYAATTAYNNIATNGTLYDSRYTFVPILSPYYTNAVAWTNSNWNPDEWQKWFFQNGVAANLSGTFNGVYRGDGTALKLPSNLLTNAASVWTTNVLTPVITTNVSYVTNSSGVSTNALAIWPLTNALTDISGNGNTLTLSKGNNVYSNGGFNLSQGGYLVSPAFNFTTTNRTVSFWLWRTPQPPPQTSGEILAGGASWGTWGWNSVAEDTAAKTIREGASSTSPMSPIYSNAWTHYVIIQGSPNTLYTNGVQNSSTNLYFGSTTSAQKFFVGANDTGYYENGSIAWVEVYDRTLTSTEVATLYNGGSLPSAATTITTNTTYTTNYNSTTVTNTGVMNPTPAAFAPSALYSLNSISNGAAQISVLGSLTMVTNGGTLILSNSAYAPATNVINVNGGVNIFANKGNGTNNAFLNSDVEIWMTDTISNLTFYGFGVTYDSQGACANKFTAGSARGNFGNFAGEHYMNTKATASGIDGRLFVRRYKDPTGDGIHGSYILEENRFDPAAPDNPLPGGVAYANYLSCDQYGNIMMGQGGQASDDSTTNNKNPDAKVMILGTTNYMPFKVHTNGYGSGVGLQVLTNGVVSCLMGFSANPTNFTPIYSHIIAGTTNVWFSTQP